MTHTAPPGTRGLSTSRPYRRRRCSSLRQRARGDRSRDAAGPSPDPSATQPVALRLAYSCPRRVASPFNQDGGSLHTTVNASFRANATDMNPTVFSLRKPAATVAAAATAQRPAPRPDRLPEPNRSRTGAWRVMCTTRLGSHGPGTCRPGLVLHPSGGPAESRVSTVQ
jgi:hypothetical protein